MKKDSPENGLYTEYFKNGYKKIEGIYLKSQRNGTWIEWYVNGQIKSKGNYKDGEKEGQWTTWHKNGQKKSKGTYGQYYRYYESTSTESLLDGDWNEWYSNGRKKTEGYYQGGEKDSTWKKWDEGGQLLKEEWFHIF